MPDVKAPAYIDERRDGKLKVLTPHGDIKGDAGLARSLPDAIKSAAETGFDVVVNCSDVGGVNRHGVQALIGSCVVAARMGPNIVLAGPAGSLLEQLDYIKMRTAIPTFPTEDAAVATLTMLPTTPGQSKDEIRRMLVDTGLRRFQFEAESASL